MRYLNATSFLALSVALTGCFSSNASPDETPVGTGPEAQVEISKVSGAVTGFGSVFIGGERYATDANTVYAVEGQSEVRGRQDRVSLGMRVRVIAQGKAGERRAVRVEIDNDLRGPVEAVTPDETNAATGILTVLGQDVRVDELTVFGEAVSDADANGAIDLRDLDPALSTGAVVVVISGYATEEGLLATRIERLDGDDADEVEVKGFVDAVGADGLSLTINGATFAVNGATRLDDGITVDAALVGRFVEVEADVLADGTLLATEIEAEDGDDAEEGESIEIEGLLQSLDLVSEPNVAVIAGRTFSIVDASALKDLIGMRVEAKLRAGADGVYTLNAVKTEVGNTIEIRDEVVSIDQNAVAFTTRLGLVITPTGASRVQDKVEKTGGDKLDVADFLRRLRPGDTIRAKGRPGTDGVVWTKIERRKNGGDRCSIKGPVDADSVFVDRFSILGVTVNTTALSDDGFELDGADGRDAFFDALEAGVVVKAKSGQPGDCQFNGLLLSGDGDVELGDDDDVEGSDDDRSGDDDDGDEGGEDDDNEVVGTVRNVDATALTFDLLERTVTVTQRTVFDDDLLRARGIETDEDLMFSDVARGLDEVLVSGDRVEVELDANGNALEIELAD